MGLPKQKYDSDIFYISHSVSLMWMYNNATNKQTYRKQKFVLKYCA